jgi:hypothetical protein
MTDDQLAEKRRQAARLARKLGLQIPKPVTRLRVCRPVPVQAPKAKRPTHCRCGRQAVAWWPDGRVTCAKHFLENTQIREVLG